MQRLLGRIVSTGHDVLAKLEGRQFYSFLVGGKTNINYKIQLLLASSEGTPLTISKRLKTRPTYKSARSAEGN